MPSRFWLSLAFVVAFGANPALAQPAPQRVASPGRAMLRSGSATPAAGQTNLTAIDSERDIARILFLSSRLPADGAPRRRSEEFP